MYLKKQIWRLLTLEFLSSFHPAGCIWVALLALRGFSLAEIGLAEGVFHAVSLCCELPSGMFADLLGRRRALAAGQLLAGLSAGVMLLAPSAGWVCVGMGLSAMGYNMGSGSREALTYDSMLQCGREGEYLRLSSTQNVVYRLAGALALLGAGVTVAAGYRAGYCADVLICLLGTWAALGLTEPEVPGRMAGGAVILRDLPAGLARCCREAGSFARHNPKIMAMLMVNALVGACATLLSFYLQAAIPAAGAGPAALGPLILVAALGNVAGSRLSPALGKLPYGVAAVLCTAAVGLGMALAGSGQPLLLALGGFAAGAGDDCVQLLTDAQLNDQIASEWRATLVSISSLCFSLVMVVLSPLGGFLVM